MVCFNNFKCCTSFLLPCPLFRPHTVEDSDTDLPHASNVHSPTRETQDESTEPLVGATFSTPESCKPAAATTTFRTGTPHAGEKRLNDASSSTSNSTTPTAKSSSLNSWSKTPNQTPTAELKTVHPQPSTKSPVGSESLAHYFGGGSARIIYIMIVLILPFLTSTDRGRSNYRFKFEHVLH